MAAATLLASLFSSPPKRGFTGPDSANLGPFKEGHAPVILQMDALISESPDYSATPTQSQVENGSTISDHVTLKPLKLTIQGLVTDTPVGFIRQFSSVFQKPSPSQQALIFLTKLWRDRLPFTFVGGLTVYNSMVITSFTPVSSAETGDALRFSCTMEQLILVSSQVILTPKKRTQPKQSLGQQPLQGFKTPVSGFNTFKSLDPTAGVTAKMATGRGGGPLALYGTPITELKGMTVMAPPPPLPNTLARIQ